MAFSLGIANLVMLRWNIVTRRVDVALSILGVFIPVQLVLGGPPTVHGWLDLFVKLGLSVAIIPTTIDAIRKVRQLLSGW